MSVCFLSSVPLYRRKDVALLVVLKNVSLCPQPHPSPPLKEFADITPIPNRINLKKTPNIIQVIFEE